MVAIRFGYFGCAVTITPKLCYKSGIKDGGKLTFDSLKSHTLQQTAEIK